MKHSFSPLRIAGLLLLGLSLLSMRPSEGPVTPISWDTLANISYEYIQNFEQNFWYGEATFSEEVKALDGEMVEIQGYILQVDLEGNSYYLSAYPFSSCFFCGGAGQESVMELRLKNAKQSFTQDELVKLRGRLRLNNRELELNYILEEAELVK
jgi:hypothetical protein